MDIAKHKKGATMARATLKKARQDKGMTQQAVADAVGVGLRHYQKLENGDTIGSVSIWDALEGLLGVRQQLLREIVSSHHDKPNNQ